MASTARDGPADPASDGLVATLPADAYTDPGRYEAERTRIFGHQWIALGHAARLAVPGTYVAEVVAGVPLVLANHHGVLRAHRNVCRHRAGPLVEDGEGSCRTFVCRYHGWTYGLDGRLRSARDFGADPDPDRFSLHPVAVATWRGLCFVNLDPDPPPLDAWLGAVVDHSAPFPMETFVPARRSIHDLACNWKVYAENYQEGYHIPLVHPGLHRQIRSGEYRTSVEGAVTVHTAPTRDGAVSAGAWLWRFPGFALNLYPNGLCVESYWPTGPTGTRVSYTFCFAPGTPEEEVEAAVESSTVILDEDRDICEAVQRNLASGAYDRGVLSPRHEAGVALVQRLVTEALADDAPGGAPGAPSGVV
jgi:choline monooxygenase